MATQRKSRDEERARAIAEAAVSVFAHKGYHGATMDEIARSAGYSPAAIYKYFRNKEDVFLEVLRVIGDDFMAVFDEPLPGSLGFPDRLRWFLARVFRLVQSKRAFFVAFKTRLEVPLDSACDQAGQAMEHQLYSTYLDRLAALMRDGMADGTLREGRPAKDLAVAFEGIGNAFFWRWMLHEDLSVEATIDTIVELFLYGASAAPSKISGRSSA